jgi:hypothetical protein
MRLARPAQTKLRSPRSWLKLAGRSSEPGRCRGSGQSALDTYPEREGVVVSENLLKRPVDRTSTYHAAVDLIRAALNRALRGKSSVVELKHAIEEDDKAEVREYVDLVEKAYRRMRQVYL